MPKTFSHAPGSLEAYCIGLKLRSLRVQKRLTLSRLAAETGLSTALLSKLETDRMIPTLPTLATISRVYGVGLNYFFAEPARHTLSITRKVHLLGKGGGPDPLRVTPLSAEGAHLEAQVIEFRPGALATTLDFAGTAVRLMYVLEGSLRLDACGRQEVLNAGDCVCLESDMALAWSAAEKRCCRVLAVTPGRKTGSRAAHAAPAT